MVLRSKATTESVVRELDEATRDLEASRMTLEAGDSKWATIQAYHSMLHAAKALLNRMGYREQSHTGLVEALHQLYEKKVVENMLKDFSKTMTLTEQLHNGRTSSENSARATLENATDFLEQAARILAAPREWFEKPVRRRRSKTRRR